MSRWKAQMCDRPLHLLSIDTVCRLPLLEDLLPFFHGDLIASSHDFFVWLASNPLNRYAREESILITSQPGQIMF